MILGIVRELARPLQKSSSERQSATEGVQPDTGRVVTAFEASEAFEASTGAGFATAAESAAAGRTEADESAGAGFAAAADESAAAGFGVSLGGR